MSGNIKNTADHLYNLSKCGYKKDISSLDNLKGNIGENNQVHVKDINPEASNILMDYIGILQTSKNQYIYEYQYICY